MQIQMQHVLREHYGLASARLTPIELGVINEKARVDRAGQSYILKRYQPQLFQPEQVRWSCEVQTRLSARGIPVPAVQPNKQGELVTQVDEACYALFAWAPGHHHPRKAIPPRAARAMGECLGQLHLALQSVQPVEAYQVPDPVKTAAKLERTLAQAERGGSPLDQIACEVLRHKLATLERIAHWAPTFAALPVQWTHGDFHDGNILFGEAEQVTAVLDFDDLCCRPPGRELMRTISLCFEPFSEAQAALFQGYAGVTKPTPAEVALYAPLWTYLSTVGIWPLESRYLHPERYQERWDPFIQPPTGWWERNCEAMTEQLLAWLGNRAE